MKHLFITLTLGLLSLQGMTAEKLATVSPISYSLSKAMLKDTSVEVEYLPPKRLPVSRIPSWIRKNASNKYDKYDAFVSISAVVEGLDLFPSLRQTNIRLVDIDIAQAIVPSGEKVVLTDKAEYFWLNTNNLLVMLGILKRDLGALWPKLQRQINQNYQTIAAQVRRLNLQLDQGLMAADVAFITLKNNKLKPFVDSLSSDIGTVEEAKELGLNFVAVSSGKKRQAGTWQIDDLSRFSEEPLLLRLQSSQETLAALLNQQ